MIRDALDWFFFSEQACSPFGLLGLASWAWWLRGQYDQFRATRDRTLEARRKALRDERRES